MRLRISTKSVGENGTGTLNISNGGTVSNHQANIGSFSGSSGTVTVGGTGSTWSNTGNLGIGDNFNTFLANGAGLLTINDGGTVNVVKAPVPSALALAQNYPNPFSVGTSAITRISFTNPSAGQVTLQIFNLLGQEVATLFDGQIRAGEHELLFDAVNLSSGVYLYRIKAGDAVSIKRMVLMK